jgi:hypothetical protein
VHRQYKTFAFFAFLHTFASRFSQNYRILPSPLHQVDVSAHLDFPNCDPVELQLNMDDAQIVIGERWRFCMQAWTPLGGGERTLRSASRVVGISQKQHKLNGR